MAANDVAAPLPQLDLLHGSIITVAVDDPGAQITALNVHGWQREGDTAGPVMLSGSFVPGMEET